MNFSSQYLFKGVAKRAIYSTVCTVQYTGSLMPIFRPLKQDARPRQSWRIQGTGSRYVPPPITHEISQMLYPVWTSCILSGTLRRTSGSCLTLFPSVSRVLLSEILSFRVSCLFLSGSTSYLSCRVLSSAVTVTITAWP